MLPVGEEALADQVMEAAVFSHRLGKPAQGLEIMQAPRAISVSGSGTKELYNLKNAKQLFSFLSQHLVKQLGVRGMNLF